MAKGKSKGTKGGAGQAGRMRRLAIVNHDRSNSRTSHLKKHVHLDLSIERKVDTKILEPLVEPVNLALFKYGLGTFEGSDYDTLLFFFRIFERVRAAEPMPLLDIRMVDRYERLLNQLRDEFFSEGEFKYNIRDNFFPEMTEAVEHYVSQLKYITHVGFIKAITDEYNQQQVVKAKKMAEQSAVESCGLSEVA